MASSSSSNESFDIPFFTTEQITKPTKKFSSEKRKKSLLTKEQLIQKQAMAEKRRQTFLQARIDAVKDKEEEIEKIMKSFDPVLQRIASINKYQQ